MILKHTVFPEIVDCARIVDRVTYSLIHRLQALNSRIECVTGCLMHCVGATDRHTESGPLQPLRLLRPWLYHFGGHMVHTKPQKKQ